MEQFKSFDITILGGGHAGLEAAWAANQFNLSVAIVTMPGVGLGSAPCNPAVGGVGKGQVVREIDAMGGLMGRLADLAGIQYRTLNESKGYAVQSTRVQIDKEKYSEFAERIIEESEITVIREKVLSVEKDPSGYFCLYGDKQNIKTSFLIVTTGTFLNGVLHTGEDITDGGRVGISQSPGMKELFSNIKTLKKRFKTGTPPRIKRHSIDFSKMEVQPSDAGSLNFHYDHSANSRNLKQVDCFLTRTNPKTLGIIRENKERSPIFNGQIQGVGPRYCPSIEDKAFRYEDRNVHHVFVEPEGLDIDSFYPNGISTSLPKEIQLEFLRTIDGLEKAEIDVFGYAVEYDVVDTLNMKRTLEHDSFEGLYFAGQVCGTSGYEEAGGQGLIAGFNAALKAKGKDPLILPRELSYIGVMIEDLVTNERDEPYRLFTARSENRLYIREDNSIERLFNFRESLELNSEVDYHNRKFIEAKVALENLCDETHYLPNRENRELFENMGLGSLKEKTTLTEVLKRSHIDPILTLKRILANSGITADDRLIRTVAITIKYRGYIAREEIENASLNKLENKTLEWKSLLDNSNLSFECKQRISKIKPETFGQLKRIEGIRPATLAFVASTL